MGRRLITWIALTLAVSVGVSCQDTVLPDKGSVIVTFSTSELLTKTTPDGDPADGGGIAIDNGVPDLFIAIANYSGNIIAQYPGANTECIETSATQVSIRFTQTLASQNWTSGNYTVYAVANTAGGVWGAPNGSAAWAAVTSASALDALCFSELSSSNLPTVSDRMPLSAKGTLSVNEYGNGQAELELQRCVAKIGFKFKNETGQQLTLTDCMVTINSISPTKGYVFPRANDAAGTARDLTLINSNLSIAPDVTTELYGNLLVFPSVAPSQTVGSRYYCDIEFKINNERKSFTDLPIHDKQSQDILALGRNQYLQIETRINKGLDVSFSFAVDDWNDKPEEILFH
ncbi:MAG: FimB/Mfa2 family fimbrial subunit [Bacteroidales bacterium]|nr:FimB/Mfa2 family fimbrial subunit [Bacteroidales bacterium]